MMKQGNIPAGRRIAAAAAACGLMVILLLAADGWAGDPLSRAWADSRAVQYAQSLYPGQTFTVTESSGGSLFRYTTWVQSEQSPDTRFDVDTRFWLFTSDRQQDSEPRHQSLVEQRWNTAIRMGKEAAVQVDAILTRDLSQYTFAPAFENCSQVDVGFEGGGQMVPANYVADLPLDGEFTQDILQKVPCRLMLQCIWPSAPSQADLQQVLAQVKQVMESNGYPFAWYNITLVDGTAQDHQTSMDNLVESGSVAAGEIPAAAGQPAG